MKRSVSTISDELRRNKVRGAYDPKKAHTKAGTRRRRAKFQGKKIVSCQPLRDFVERSLLAGRSPESIAGRLGRHEKNLPSVSADSIERFLKSVHGRKIEAHRTTLKIKRNRRKRRAKVTELKDRTFIDTRLKIISRRGRVGDAEADFIVSGKRGRGIILTVADRKIRVSFLEKILPVSIAHVHMAFLRIKKRYPEMRTITTDNDILFAHHKELEKLLGVKIYFCQPYHSWEKGTIENTNGEVRKDIPKSSDISTYTRRFIRSIETKLNDRYMACLKFATPQESLDRHRKRKKRAVARRKKK